jgi:hypothetical protein
MNSRAMVHRAVREVAHDTLGVPPTLVAVVTGAAGCVDSPERRDLLRLSGRIQHPR